MAKKNISLVRRAEKLAALADRLKQAGGRQDAAFCLAFMTDQTRAPAPHEIANALPPGAAVIFRDYGLPNRAATAARLREICAARGLLFIVGADWRLAEQIEADGVHMPSWANAPNNASDMLFTSACHNAADLEFAARRGAHLAFLSPAFATASHPAAAALGPEQFKSLAAAAALPVIALGGITAANGDRLAGPNVVGLAAIGAFLSDR